MSVAKSTPTVKLSYVIEAKTDRGEAASVRPPPLVVAPLAAAPVRRALGAFFSCVIYLHTKENLKHV